MDLTQFIVDALNEDIGDGDHTSLASIPADTQGKAKIYAKEAGVIAGIELAEQIFHTADTDLQISRVAQDGDCVSNGDTLMEVSGNTLPILKAERLVLNCMQRMSGIATLTHKMVKLPGFVQQLVSTVPLKNCRA